MSARTPPLKHGRLCAVCAESRRIGGRERIFVFLLRLQWEIIIHNE